MNIGSNIGQYRIVRKIGAGGMGTVFVGEHILLGRRAAIKTLLPALTMHKEIVDRFFNEARATSAITDPGVVQVFDFGYHVDGTAYIVMELLEGEGLAARLERLGRLVPAEALRIARQVAGALAAAHAADIIHRDLKPENVFIIRDPESPSGERAKLLDFGICKVNRSDTTLTESGAMLGTPVYMSPEQCQGARTVDGRSDLYGLGCVMFQMMTGRAPFEHEGAGDLIVAHLQHEPPAPSSFAPELPPVIDELIATCLKKAPEDRFQSMQALQVAIDQILPDLTPVPFAVDAPSAMALASGFKSHYDGNFGTVMPTRKSPPTPAWFVTPSTLQSATGESQLLDGTDAPNPKRSMFTILLSGVVVALVAVGLGRYETVDEIAPAVAAATATPTAIDAGVGPADGGSIDASAPLGDARAAEPRINEPAVATTEVAKPATAPAKIEKPATKQPVATRRPSVKKQTMRPVRRVVRAPAPQPAPTPQPPAPTTEDLYETR